MRRKLLLWVALSFVFKYILLVYVVFAWYFNCCMCFLHVESCFLSKFTGGCNTVTSMSSKGWT